jgi:hypothetical protein
MSFGKKRQIGWNVTKPCSIQLSRNGGKQKPSHRAPSRSFHRCKPVWMICFSSFVQPHFIVVWLGKLVKLVLEHLMHMRAFFSGNDSTAFPETSF